jgi:hypothetical protein
MQPVYKQLLGKEVPAETKTRATLERFFSMWFARGSYFEDKVTG